MLACLPETRIRRNIATLATNLATGGLPSRNPQHVTSQLKLGGEKLLRLTEDDVKILVAPKRSSSGTTSAIPALCPVCLNENPIRRLWPRQWHLLAPCTFLFRNLIGKALNSITRDSCERNASFACVGLVIVPLSKTPQWPCFR